MSGPATGATGGRVAAGLPVLLVSGDLGVAAPHAMAEAGIRATLAKPLDTAALLGCCVALRRGRRPARWSGRRAAPAGRSGLRARSPAAAQPWAARLCPSGPPCAGRGAHAAARPASRRRAPGRCRPATTAGRCRWPARPSRRTRRRQSAQLVHQHHDTEQPGQALHAMLARDQSRGRRQRGHVARAHHEGEAQHHLDRRRRGSRHAMAAARAGRSPPAAGRLVAPQRKADQAADDIGRAGDTDPDPATDAGNPQRSITPGMCTARKAM